MNTVSQKEILTQKRVIWYTSDFSYSGRGPTLGQSLSLPEY